MNSLFRQTFLPTLLFAAVFLHRPASAQADYQILVTNEKSDDITIISGTDHQSVATVPVGKRPRGIQASPDWKIVFIAVSGTPMSSPRNLIQTETPFLRRTMTMKMKEGGQVSGRNCRDGFGRRNVVRKIKVGSDPEQLALSKDGKQLYVSNEDVGTATVLTLQAARWSTSFPSAASRRG